MNAPRKVGKRNFRNRPVIEVTDEIEGVLVQHFLLVISLRYQIIELLPQIMEEDGVLVDVLEEILPGSQTVLVELDLSVLVIKVQHRVQRVIIQSRINRFLACGYGLFGILAQRA